MKVKQLMHKKIVTVSDLSSIHDAALMMKKEEVGSVLVVDEEGKLVGIVTDRDIAMAVAADRKDPGTACVYDIMTMDPVVVMPDNDIDSVLKIMNRENIRRLPVCENGKLIGMLSSADIAAGIKDEFNQFIGLEGAFAKHS